MRLRLIPGLLMLFALLLAFPAAASAEEESPSPSPSESATTNTPPSEGSWIGVTLRNDAERDDEGNPTPVPGVTISVTDKDGQEVGSGVTDSGGRVFIPIPGNGTYKVSLDTDTLPEGIELSGKGATEKTVQVLIEGGTFVQFQIGFEPGEGKGFASKLEASLLSGMKFGFIIALAALGLSMVFGTTGLTNFAHGELITFGALATYIFNVSVGLPVIWAGVAAMIAGGIFGYLNDVLLWRPLRHRGTGLIAMMIVSIGLALLLRSIFQYYFGGATRTLSEYVAQRQRSYGPIDLAPKELAIMLVALVVITIVCIAIMKTRTGKAMRAVSDNPGLAASSGLRVDGVIGVVWVVGTALTALAGTLLAVNSQVNFLMGFKILLLVFAAVVLGGLGTIWGALIGSMIIGILVEIGPLFGVPPSIKDVGALIVLILILLVRPQGILGRAQRVG